MRYRPASLDALNVLLADVRGAFGPFLVVYLTSRHGWTQGDVGVMAAATGLAAVALQTPAGALVDRIAARRGVIVAALLVLASSSLVLFAASGFWAVTLGNGLAGIAGDLFAPSVTALTLGLTARAALARRIGRNSAFDHAGNIAIALLIGGVGTFVSQRAVFLLVPIFALLAAAATLSIPAGAVDDRRARGLDRADGGEDGPVLPIQRLFGVTPLLVLAVSVFLFHMANAAMLPLVGQELAERHPKLADGMMALCIVAAQGVMMPLALLVGHKADSWGRKPIFVAAFLILPIRGVLYTLGHAPVWLIGVQILDGVGAGIYGAIVPLIVADLTRGTGRFNLAQGLVATAMGAGASLSPLLAGLAHDALGGYRAAWLSLTAVATFGLIVFSRFMPETRADGASRAATAPRGRVAVRTSGRTIS